MGLGVTGLSTTNGIANTGNVGTDAVNKNYVDQSMAFANTRLDRAFGEIEENTGGIAIAIAMGGLALPEGKTFAISGNFGFYDGHQAFAAQTAIRLNDTFALTGGVGIGFNNSKAGGRVGVQAAW